MRAGYAPDKAHAWRDAKHPDVLAWLAEQRAKRERHEEMRAAKAPPPPPPDPDEPEHIRMARETFAIAKANRDVRGMTAALAAMTPSRGPGRRSNAEKVAAEREEASSTGRRAVAPYERREPTKKDLEAIRREHRHQYDIDHARAIWGQREDSAAFQAALMQQALDARQRCLDAPEPDPDASDEDNLETVSIEEKDALRRMTDEEVLEWWCEAPDCLDAATPAPPPSEQRAAAEAVLDRVLRDRL
jgi:hypothetical protein